MRNLRLPALLGLCAGVLHSLPVGAQAVTGIVTDYNGFWQSSVATPNATKPENSHNLLAFTFNGVRYSTGVNNAALAAQSLTYVSGDYRALGVSNISAAGTSTRIGLGASWDGVANGASSPVPSNALAPYITDGIQGLDIGTGVANLPSGTLLFGVSNLQPSAIGDGVPDILVTQIADPSGGTDSYQFVNSSNATVGTSVSVSFTAINPVGTWTGDFYRAQAPVTLASGETRVDKPVRLWAADFSAFGITAGNASSITGFRINLNGNSDVAFIAYNHAVISILPVTLRFFNARAEGEGVALHWQSPPDPRLARTEVEWGLRPDAWRPLGIVAAANTTAVQDYRFYHDKPSGGTQYYRLKLVGVDGGFKYSHTVRVSRGAGQTTWNLWPNPTTGLVRVAHSADAEGELQVLNAAGATVVRQRIIPGSGLTELNADGLPPGVYRVVPPGEGKASLSFVKL